MLLTVSKRLEFSASRRFSVSGCSDKENATAFWPETNARYGSGRNVTVNIVYAMKKANLSCMAYTGNAAWFRR